MVDDDDGLLPHFEAVEAARVSLPEPVTLTWFEFTTLAVMRLFAERGLDAVILEVGLGRAARRGEHSRCRLRDRDKHRHRSHRLPRRYAREDRV